MSTTLDWGDRMRRTLQFVGFGTEELALVTDTGPILLEKASELTSAVYDHFLVFPETRRYFVTRSGDVDEERIERRKHSLARWLENTIKAEGDLPMYLLAIAVVHSHPPTNRSNLGSIPSRFMIGTVSLVQTAISNVLAKEIMDPAVATQASIAWNKLLIAQLDILLAGYITETPVPRAEI